MNKYLLSVCGLALSLSAGAAEIEFTYNATGMEPTGYGFKKEQTYDMAIALNTQEIIGKTILGFTVPVFDVEYVSSPRVWVSKELTASKGDTSTFTPDIASYEVEIADGVINFTFPEPFVIPEEGVFLGYSLTVGGLPEGVYASPVAVADGTNAGGLWIHANASQKKWADFAVRNSIVSAMTVTLEGDFAQNAATFALDTDQLFEARNEPCVLPISIENYGTEGIKSFAYRYTLNGSEYEGMCELEEPVAAILGRKAFADVEIASLSETGDYTVEFEMTKVNGVDNEITLSPLSVPLQVQPFLAVYRPLVEEYTGLGCGWCPRGYVMLEQMKMYYGDRFVGMAYHNYNNDGMTCADGFPVSVSGAPSACFNRGGSVDPSKIPDMWVRTMHNNTPADVDVTLAWADETQTKLTATARVRFVKDYPESTYRFSFALVADGLHNDKWVQNNSYGDYEAEGEYTGPFWNLFVGKGSPVAGLEFNDVVVYYKEMNGIEGSLPEAIEAEKWYEYTYEIDTADVVDINGKPVVADNGSFEKTRMIAIVMDNTGKPLNCASSTYIDGTFPIPDSVETVTGTPVETVYYDLQGRRIEQLGKGIYIRLDRLSDGTTRTSKVVR